MADLKRYNVLDEKYEDYDKESDIKYATMIKDFKIVLGTILSELCLLFLISGFSQKNIEGLFGFIVGLVLLVIVIVVFIEKLIKRKIGWKKIWDITKRLAILGVILAITLYIEWKQYFWICKKYTALRKAGVDKKYINKARKQKEQFQNLIFRKIDNMEMSVETCSLYRKLSEYLFEDELSKLYRAKGEEWTKFIKEINKSELEGLWKTDKSKFNEIYRLLYGLLKQMKEMKEQ